MGEGEKKKKMTELLPMKKIPLRPTYVSNIPGQGPQEPVSMNSRVMI